MSDVEKVALWVGLIASVISIALSVVATIFAVLVNYRSEKVSDQTIKSLQKIESDVARLSSDTSGLIKAGWDKLVGTFGQEHEAPTRDREEAANEIASGLTSEIRTELEDSSEDEKGELSPAVAARLDAALSKIQETLAAQIVEGGDNSSGAVFEKATRMQRLSEEARELARQIGTIHLTRKQYSQLRNGALASATKELRRLGILVPLSDGDTSPVYWFPTGGFRPALMLIPPSRPEVSAFVSSELAKTGYRPKYLA